MSTKIIAVYSTTGPVYRAALSLVATWIEVNGLPDRLSIDAPPGGRVVVACDHVLATYLQGEFTRLGNRIMGSATVDWPGGGRPPSSCRAEEV